MAGIAVYPEFQNVRAPVIPLSDWGDIIRKNLGTGYDLGQMALGVPQRQATLQNELTAGKLAALPFEIQALQQELSLAPLLAEAKYLSSVAGLNKPISVGAGGLYDPATNRMLVNPTSKEGTVPSQQFVGVDEATEQPILFNPKTGTMALGTWPGNVKSLRPRTLPQPTVMEGTVDGQPGVVTVRQTPGGPVASPVTVNTPGGKPAPLQPKAEPVAEGVQENLQGTLNTLGAIKDLEAGLPETGRFEGWWSKAQAFFGKNKKAVDFEAARNALKLDAQALIKGIPSNFDVGTLIDTLPDLTLPEEVNRSRLEITKKKAQDLIRNTVGYYKGTKRSIPSFIIDQARDLGVDVDSAPAWNGKGDPLTGGGETTTGGKMTLDEFQDYWNKKKP